MELVDSRIYTLERGRRPPNLVEVCQLKKILQQSQKSKEAGEKYVQELIQISEQNDHSGIYFRVTFRTDRPIILHSLGFWGPHTEEQADYEVSVIISELSSLMIAKQKSKVVSKFRVNARAKRGQVFLVQLNQPVVVSTTKWIQIEFQLNGPPTFRSEEMIFRCEEPHVTFHFSDSSLQLPIIKYKLA